MWNVRTQETIEMSMDSWNSLARELGALPDAASKEAPVFVRRGGNWEPEVHFTGTVGEVEHLGLIASLIAVHRGAIVAYFLYLPFPGTFSLELQFGDEEATRACLTEYRSAFGPGGRLRSPKKRKS
jgi:hypothetical protein